MKILFVSNKSVYSGAAVGGAETSMSVMAEEMACLNHTVVYLAQNPKQVQAIQQCKVSGVQVVQYRPLKLPTLGMPILRRWSRNLLHRQQQRVFYAIIRQYDIDAIYAFGSVTYELLRLREQKQLRFKLMHRVAGVTRKERGATPNPERVRRSEYGFTHADCINFQSEQHRESYLEIAQNVSKLKFTSFIHDIGIHPSFFDYPLSQRCGSVFQLVCIMRFSERKRQDLLVEALHQLNQPGIKLTFVGEGPERKSLEARVKAYGLESQIIFKGFLSRTQLQQELAQASLYCHPVDYEPQSKALWEAMASKVPILASDVATISNLITEGVNGYLCNNTVEGWRNKLELIYNQEDSNSLIQQAYNDVLAAAHPQQNIRKYTAKFEQLVHEKG